MTRYANASARSVDGSRTTKSGGFRHQHHQGDPRSFRPGPAPGGDRRHVRHGLRRHDLWLRQFGGTRPPTRGRDCSASPSRPTCRGREGCWRSIRGGASYPISNGHGDVVGTTDASGVFTANPPIDEFGVGTPPSGALGYLGDKERLSTGGNLDLIRMGVRLYDPKLGRFLEVDPVAGGCSNDYAYVHGDPNSEADPTGAVACHNYAYNTRDRTARLEIRRTGNGAYINGRAAVEYYIELQPRAAYRNDVDYGYGRVTGLNPYSSKGNSTPLGRGDTRDHARPTGTRSIHFRFYAIAGTTIHYDIALAWQDRTVGYGSFLNFEWWKGGIELRGVHSMIPSHNVNRRAELAQALASIGRAERTVLSVKPAGQSGSILEVLLQRRGPGEVHLSLDLHFRQTAEDEWLPLGGGGTTIAERAGSPFNPNIESGTVFTFQTEALPDAAPITGVTGRILYIRVIDSYDVVMESEPSMPDPISK